MESYERKIAPDLLRWVRKDEAEQRTVMVRLAYSQDPEDAADTIGRHGMTVQSNGPGLVIASSDCAAVKHVAELPWVVSIDVPRTLQMKKGFGKL